jgi:hypothetical protein
MGFKTIFTSSNKILLNLFAQYNYMFNFKTFDHFSRIFQMSSDRTYIREQIVITASHIFSKYGFRKLVISMTIMR